MSRIIHHTKGQIYTVHFIFGESKEVKDVKQFSRDEDLGLIIIIADKTYLFNCDTVKYIEHDNHLEEK